MGHFPTNTTSLSRVQAVEMIVMSVILLFRMEKIVINHFPAFIANATGFVIVLTTNLHGIRGRYDFMTIRAYPHFLAFWMSLNMQ